MEVTKIWLEARKFYDAQNDTFNGNDSVANAFASIFDDGKQIYTRNCLSCHGGSGNAQGPYARHVVAQPANLHERILTYILEPAVKVSQIMSKNIIGLQEDVDAVNALKLMTVDNIGRIIVRNGEKISGIVSRTDLMRAVQLLGE